MISGGKLGSVVKEAIAKACAASGTSKTDECAQKTEQHIEREVKKACSRSYRTDHVSLGRCQQLLGNTLWESHKELKETLGKKMPYLVRLLTSAYPISDSRGVGYEGINKTVQREAEIFDEKFPGEKRKTEEKKNTSEPLRSLPLSNLYDEKRKAMFAFTRVKEWTEVESALYFHDDHGDLFSVHFNWYYWLEPIKDGKYVLYTAALQEKPSGPPGKDSEPLSFKLKENQYPPLLFSFLGKWKSGKPVFQGIRIEKPAE